MGNKCFGIRADYDYDYDYEIYCKPCYNRHLPCLCRCVIERNARSVELPQKLYDRFNTY